MDALVEFCSKFEEEHIVMMLLMFLVGLLMGYALWFRRQKLIDEAVEAKERAENHAEERERALEKLRKTRI